VFRINGSVDIPMIIYVNRDYLRFNCGAFVIVYQVRDPFCDELADTNSYHANGFCNNTNNKNNNFK